MIQTWLEIANTTGRGRRLPEPRRKNGVSKIEDAKNVMMEIRAGTGGDEASSILQGIYHMYTKYWNRGWRTSVVDMNEEHLVEFKGKFFWS
jgi:hypothetical protein